MVGRRHGRRRRRRQTPSPPLSSTIAALAFYLLSLSSTPRVATTAAVSATPQHPGQVGVDVGRPKRGGGIGGKGQQGLTIDRSWAGSDEEELERVSKRGTSGQDGGKRRNSDRNEDTERLQRSLSGGRDGAKEDEKTCGAIKTIGGTVPDVLEDSAWCVEEEDCVQPPADGGADVEHEQRSIPTESLDGSTGASTKTIGGTVPDVLADSAWCVGEEDCVRPSEKVAGDDEQTGHVARDLGGSSLTSPASVYGGGISAGAVDGACGPEVETGSGVSAAAATVVKGSIPGEDHGVPDGEALERPASERASGVSDGHPGGGASTDAIASLESADPHPDENDVHGEAAAAATAAVYPYSGPASSEQQSAPTSGTPYPDVAPELASQQERRGPLVKGEGANTNTDIRRGKTDRANRRDAPAAVAGDGGEPTEHDERGARRRGPERRGRGDAGGARGRKGRGSPRGRDLSTETAEDHGGQGEVEDEGEEEGLERVAAVGPGRSSWRKFACALLVCALVFGTYLRGTLLSWVPSPLFGRDPREGWAIDLDSAIANARSRASSLCSGRASVFSEDPVDDSDLPELISDHEGGDDSGGGHGDRGTDDDREVPLMWDTRPKPDDFLVYHPVLGVVPAGAVRAWGGDGCGGWSGDKAGGNGRAASASSAAGTVTGSAVNGGNGPECVTGGRSKEPRCSPRCDLTGETVPQAVGDGKRKRLPPVRNTDEWFKWVAAREATPAAANVPDEASPVAAVTIEKTAASSLIPPDGAGVAPPDEAGEAGAGAAAKKVVSAQVPGGDRAISGGSERERSGGGRAITATTAEATAGAQKPPSSLSHTPTALSLQFGVGNGSGDACNGGASGGGGGGGESSAEGGPGRPGGHGDSGSGCDDSLSFGGGCSPDDGREVRVDDFSARLSSEQPPAVTAAYHVS
eukprot:g5389.t1